MAGTEDFTNVLLCASISQGPDRKCEVDPVSVAGILWVRAEVLNGSEAWVACTSVKIGLDDRVLRDDLQRLKKSCCLRIGSWHLVGDRDEGVQAVRTEIARLAITCANTRCLWRGGTETGVRR